MADKRGGLSIKRGMLSQLSGGVSEAFDAVSTAAVIFDRDLHIIRRNAAGKALLAEGATIADVLAPAPLPAGAREWPDVSRRVVVSGETVRFEGLAYNVPNFPPRRIDLCLSPLRSTGETQIAGGILTADDVTSVKRLEAELAELERLAGSGRLVARVAHELNNPLDGILRYVNLALRLCRDGGPSKIADYLSESRKGLLRMMQITGDLLAYARASRDESQANHVNRIVEEAVRSMQDRATELGVVITASYRDESMPSVRGTRLYQVCCNIIKNALDAMGGGGMLTIRTGVVSGSVVLKFEDTGPGLPKDVQKIFEPFFTTKSGDEGTGLGLSICRDLIGRLGGTITAVSRPEGGASFTVSFPAELKDCAPRPE